MSAPGFLATVRMCLRLATRVAELEVVLNDVHVWIDGGARPEDTDAIHTRVRAALEGTVPIIDIDIDGGPELN